MAYNVNSQGLAALSIAPVGGQPPFDPGDVEGFLAAPRIAILAYARADGRPVQSPIWYVYRDGRFYMSTASDSPKTRALGRNPRVCLTIQDEAPPYRALMIDGTIEQRPMPADDPTAEIALRYFGRLGAAEYDRLTRETHETNGLTSLVLHPSAARGFDNTKAVGALTLAFLRLRRRLPIPDRWL